jgi:hypothetical protein
MPFAAIDHNAVIAAAARLERELPLRIGLRFAEFRPGRIEHGHLRAAER